jgi:hypothetical protein
MAFNFFTIIMDKKSQIQKWQIKTVEAICADPTGVWHINIPRRYGKTRILQEVAKHWLHKVRVITTCKRSKDTNFPNFPNYDPAVEPINEPGLLLVDDYNLIPDSTPLIFEAVDKGWLVVVTSSCPYQTIYRLNNPVNVKMRRLPEGLVN